MYDDHWSDQALCHGMDGSGGNNPDIFFPISARRDDIEFNPDVHVRDPIEAKKVCSKCPVKEPCLDYALTNPEATTDGVWGGLTRRERKRLGRK